MRGWSPQGSIEKRRKIEALPSAEQLMAIVTTNLQKTYWHLEKRLLDNVIYLKLVQILTKVLIVIMYRNYRFINYINDIQVQNCFNITFICRY